MPARWIISLHLYTHVYFSHGKYSAVAAATVLEWRALSQRFIDKSIDEWRRRLQCVVDQNDEHIEHVFHQLSAREANAVMKRILSCTKYSD